MPRLGLIAALPLPLLPRSAFTRSEANSEVVAVKLALDDWQIAAQVLRWRHEIGTRCPD